MASQNDKSAGSKWSIEEKPVKVNKWDATAVKHGLDDAAKKALIKRGYVENHSLMDGRLLICTIAVLFAGFALLWDYLHPFPDSRPVLIICVLSYFFMMGVLTLYTTMKEKAIFCVAVEKDKAGVDPDNVCTFSSLMKSLSDKDTGAENYFWGFIQIVTSLFTLDLSPISSARYDDLYTLTLELRDGKSGSERAASCHHSVTEFYDDNGQLCLDLWEPVVYKLYDSLLLDKKTK